MELEAPPEPPPVKPETDTAHIWLRVAQISHCDHPSLRRPADRRRRSSLGWSGIPIRQAHPRAELDVKLGCSRRNRKSCVLVTGELAAWHAASNASVVTGSLCVAIWRAQIDSMLRGSVGFSRREASLPSVSSRRCNTGVAASSRRVPEPLIAAWTVRARRITSFLLSSRMSSPTPAAAIDRSGSEATPRQTHRDRSPSSRERRSAV